MFRPQGRGQADLFRVCMTIWNSLEEASAVRGSYHSGCRKMPMVFAHFTSVSQESPDNGCSHRSRTFGAFGEEASAAVSAPGGWATVTASTVLFVRCEGLHGCGQMDPSSLWTAAWKSSNSADLVKPSYHSGWEKMPSVIAHKTLVWHASPFSAVWHLLFSSFASCARACARSPGCTERPPVASPSGAARLPGSTADASLAGHGCGQTPGFCLCIHAWNSSKVESSLTPEFHSGWFVTPRLLVICQTTLP
mmetsp:Transcript_72496/g.196050  ORF Transcript_72496/g.196050 Transcript_72496/m.196050 type:complete len:250 (+) Transcript_72496:1105-1854(+)